MSRRALLALTALWISLIPNWPTYQAFLNSSDSGAGLWRALFVSTAVLFVFSLSLITLSAVGVFFRGKTLKWWCASAVVLAAALSYFSVFLGTLFDSTMFANAIATHPGEAWELLGWRQMAWLIGVGLVPAIVLIRIPLKTASTSWKEPSWKQQLGHQSKHILQQFLMLCGLAALTAGLVLAQFQSFSSAARNRTISFHTVAPWNIIAAGISYYSKLHSSHVVRAPFAQDAKQVLRSGAMNSPPRLMLFVLGETARAQNYQLNGYARPTNPRMSSANAVYFPDTISCGTATAFSVPCMFSGLSHDDFSLNKANGRDSLLDIMARAGIKVIWIDNDGGCKGVCERIEYVDLTASKDPKHCPEPGICQDSLLLEPLQQRLNNITQDTAIFIHIKGSHGPAYYKRYPKEFEKFTPTCLSNELNSCTTEELRNAYDNSIVYTDHILGESIELLKRHASNTAAMMFYVSDHGESLGERGLFLHGLPYAIAPKEQTRVPMLAWFANNYHSTQQWASGCEKTLAKPEQKHENIFHTVLGLFNITTSVYRSDLDLFAACTKK